MSDVKYYNQYTNPRCMKAIDGRWNASVAGQREDGRWTYSAGSANDHTMGTVYVNSTTGIVAGDVIVAIIEYPDKPSMDPAMYIEYCTTLFVNRIASDTYLIASRANYDGRKPVQGRCSSFTPLHIGIFSAEDWPKIQQLYETGTLKLPWFDGDTFPRQTTN